MQIELDNVKQHAIERAMKFFLPWISPNKEIPQNADTNPGPVQMIGKAIENPRASFARNQQAWAIPHMTPLTKAAIAIRISANDHLAWGDHVRRVGEQQCYVAIITRSNQPREHKWLVLHVDKVNAKCNKASKPLHQPTVINKQHEHNINTITMQSVRLFSCCKHAGSARPVSTRTGH